VADLGLSVVHGGDDRGPAALSSVRGRRGGAIRLLAMSTTQRTLPPESEDHIYEMLAVARAKAGITSLPVDLGEALRRMEASSLAIESEPLCVRRASPSAGAPDRSGTLCGTVHGDVVGRIRVCAVLCPMSYVVGLRSLGL
jgi:hypothetical protein